MSDAPLELALLDRDGTLNVKAPDGAYITSINELVLMPGAAEAVRRLNRAGTLVAIVTNQRAVARGLLDEHGLADLHADLAARLAEQGAHVDAIYHCPHDLGSCSCRKPLPGLLERALRDFGVTPSEAVMIGDAQSDVEAGRRAGVATVQLTDAPERSSADRTAPDLLSAVTALLEAP